MALKVDDQRKKTMLARIGEAAELVDDQRFLPFYRGVQIRLEKAGKADEWGRMIAAAKGKENPARYFATLCKMVRDGTYIFVEKVAEKAKEIANHTRLYLSDKLVKFGFGKYQKYYVRKAAEFINRHGEAGFIELLEFADRKKVSQKYMAKALINGKPPRQYYTENVIGGAQ